MDFIALIEAVGQIVDLAGVAIILGGIALATAYFAYSLFHRTPLNNAYERYRRGIGRALLLGLEILVAADIIRTVAISPTFESVAVLALIVVVRTFLSWSLELELSGRWPWQRSEPVPNEQQES
ncbi:MAG: DUF1622 domain-containing protein [Chloroflexota bacterium]